MSGLTAMARVLAAETGTRQAICTLRHLHVAARPIVLVPITLAGETNAPLAVLVGDDRDRPQLIVTNRPRVREERLRFAERLGAELLLPIANLARRTEVVPTTRRTTTVRRRAVEAPQIWVPNPAGVEFLRLLGRMTRFRSTVGQWAVAPSVPTLGIWATWFAEQSEFADSSVLVATTQALTAMWATGQSDLEDGNLAALMAWIDPPPGTSAADAAARAEDTIAFPPAGPATDPQFDAVVLEPALRDLDAAPDDQVRERVLARLASGLRDQMQPTWDRVWRAIDLLDAVPAAPHVAVRWERDRERFYAFADYLNTIGLPQARQDGAVRGARRLTDLEVRKSTFDAQRAYDDALVMAEYRLSGEAFRGIVVDADADRVVRPSSRRVRRPLITVTTRDPARLAPGDRELRDPQRPTQEAAVIDVESDGAQTRIRLELSGGLGSGTTGPAPSGSVPAVGDVVTYTRLKAGGYTHRGTFPNREDTPWTHGGPPAEYYVPTSHDAAEDWS
ncbi:hypothetical protein [Micromonospora tulbaghiae]|uniref:Uncharacterized protein n=1 Tax=Micromonospora tulbaghiae TaxID=479978 RepID=A0ABY0KS74_9ACTN|nr:hypothetical protein [Micromonospora tulbaghiae]SCF01052.1 hypothetical protein GA0070562_5090 [Micromonospora tulbaghiae]